MCLIYISFVIIVTKLLNGSLSSFVIRHEETKIWVVDDAKNKLLEIDIESKRSLHRDKNEIHTR